MTRDEVAAALLSFATDNEWTHDGHASIECRSCYARFPEGAAPAGGYRHKDGCELAAAIAAFPGEEEATFPGVPAPDDDEPQVGP